MKRAEAIEILTLNGIAYDPVDKVPLTELVRRAHFGGPPLRGVVEVISPKIIARVDRDRKSVV